MAATPDPALPHSDASDLAGRTHKLNDSTPSSALLDRDNLPIQEIKQSPIAPPEVEPEQVLSRCPTNERAVDNADDDTTNQSEELLEHKRDTSPPFRWKGLLRR